MRSHLACNIRILNYFCLRDASRHEFMSHRLQEKVALKEEKDKAEAKFKVALVDNRKEGVSSSPKQSQKL